MASEAQTRTQRSVTAEEEALRRNTDCVYYLASPLTCKKGNDCEFRHSEIARLNSQDCWFWLTSNCLNPKCGFRHPSLDVRVGTQTPTSNGHSATKNTPYAPKASGKQTVPCVFFQNGYCLKGDWCPFLHAPSSMSNKAIKVPASASASESIKNAIDMIEKSVQAKKPPPLAVKSVKQVLEPKPAYEIKTDGPTNEFFHDRSSQHGLGTSEFPGFRNAAPSRNLVGWSDPIQQSHLFDDTESMSVKEAEGVSREHSPGFDVLVDDNVMKGSDYYANEDRYGISGEKNGRNDYDLGGSEDYVDIDDDRYQDQYAWEQHRASSERQRYAGNDSHEVHESDLRHRLSKHKKPNGLRSVISREDTTVMHVQDRLGPHADALLSSRLRGRIRFPRRSSSPSNGDITRVRTGITSQLGRIQEKRRGRFENSYSDGGKNNKDADLRRRHNVRDDNKPLGKRKFSSAIEGHQQRPDNLNFDGQQRPDNLNFDGPKSLDEILKRKRGEANGDKTIKSSVVIRGNVHEDVDSSTYKEVSEYAPQSLTNMTEEGKQHIVETADFHTAEANGERDEGYNYEQTGEEDEYCDGENGDGVEEYADDNDDFSNKMSLIHSSLGVEDS